MLVQPLHSSRRALFCIDSTLFVDVMEVRDHTLSMQEGGLEGFCGVMKYVRHVWIGHEIYFKIFDRPQNILLCSIFVISFFQLRGLERKIPKLSIKEIQEREHMLNKSHPIIHSADIRQFDPNASVFNY